MLRQLHQLSAPAWNILAHCHSHYQQLWLRTIIIKTPDPFNAEASEVIDVRAPSEYQRDHIPGALNLPVLDNAQFTAVGTVHAMDAFEGRKLGASIVSRNISDLISNYFNSKGEDYCPLVYCWRGGQRSQSLAIVLSQTGFRVLMLEGGYRTYRRAVIRDLQELPLHFTFKILTGLTGTGKTLLLRTLHDNGAQVLDLEGLARHKGSVLGLWHRDRQPSQKFWESQIRWHLTSFDRSRPVWVESESRKLGNLYIPPALFSKMCEGDRTEICLPLDERVQHILKGYPHWTEDTDSLKQLLSPLKKVRGQKALDTWFRLADRGRWAEFVKTLLIEHYDLTYAVSQRKNLSKTKKDVIQLSDLSDKSIADFVRQVL